MRIFVLNIISALVLLASTGLKLEAHYCHGHFAGIKFVYNSCCCDEKIADCCEDKTIQVEKADFDYAPQQLNKLSAKDHTFCNLFLWDFPETDFSYSPNKRISSRGSPPDGRPAFYLIYHRLLFYG
jgi:hypothetical protein